MKGIVLEKKNHKIAVLCDDGSIIKMRSSQYEVGQRFDIEDKKRKHISAMALRYAVLTAAVVVCMFTAHFYYNVQACSYVTLDASSSLEYTLNRRDKVTAVRGLDEASQEIASTLDVAGMSIEEAINTSIHAMNLGDQTTSALVSVVSDTEEHSSSLKQSVEDHIDESINAQVVQASEEDRKAAESANMSTGRYETAQAENGLENPDSAEYYKNAPIDDLLNNKDAPQDTHENVPSQNTDAVQPDQNLAQSSIPLGNESSQPSEKQTQEQNSAPSSAVPPAGSQNSNSDQDDHTDMQQPAGSMGN